MKIEGISRFDAAEVLLVDLIEHPWRGDRELVKVPLTLRPFFRCLAQPLGLAPVGRFHFEAVTPVAFNPVGLCAVGTTLAVFPRFLSGADLDSVTFAVSLILKAVDAAASVVLRFVFWHYGIISHAT